MKKWLTFPILLLSHTAFAKDLPPGITTPAHLKIGDRFSKEGTFDYQGDQDAFKLWLPKGINFGVDLQTFCGSATLKLFDRQWRPLGTSVPVGQHAWVEQYTSYAGGYYAQIVETSHCAEEPTYTLTTNISCAATRQTQCTLPLGETKSGTLRAGADKDWYRFSVTQAGDYAVSAEGDASGNGWANPGVLSLRRGDTSVIRQSGNCSAGLTCVAAHLDPGTYFVALRIPKSEHPTGYQITLTPKD